MAEYGGELEGGFECGPAEGLEVLEGEEGEEQGKGLSVFSWLFSDTVVIVYGFVMMIDGGVG